MDSFLKAHMHSLVSLAIVGLVFLLTGAQGVLPATTFLAGLWVGREQAQAEYKWIERYGGGKRNKDAFPGSFDRRVWDYHSLFENLIYPVVVSLALSGALFFLTSA